MNTKFFCLFEGRHDLPENEGAIVASFDFDTHRCVRTPLWDKALTCLRNGDIVKLIVTGLTPALIEFISNVFQFGEVNFGRSGKQYINNLILLHYDSNTKEYWSQTI